MPSSVELLSLVLLLAQLVALVVVDEVDKSSLDEDLPSSSRSISTDDAGGGGCNN